MTPLLCDTDGVRKLAPRVRGVDRNGPSHRAEIAAVPAGRIIFINLDAAAPNLHA
jgi:hypothetical protein